MAELEALVDALSTVVTGRHDVRVYVDEAGHRDHSTRGLDDLYSASR